MNHCSFFFNENVYLQSGKKRSWINWIFSSGHFHQIFHPRRSCGFTLIPCCPIRRKFLFLIFMVHSQQNIPNVSCYFIQLCANINKKLLPGYYSGTHTQLCWPRFLQNSVGGTSAGSSSDGGHVKFTGFTELLAELHGIHKRKISL